MTKIVFHFKKLQVFISTCWNQSILIIHFLFILDISSYGSIDMSSLFAAYTSVEVFGWCSICDVIYYVLWWCGKEFWGFYIICCIIIGRYYCNCTVSVLISCFIWEIKWLDSNQKQVHGLRTTQILPAFKGTFCYCIHNDFQ